MDQPKPAQRQKPRRSHPRKNQGQPDQEKRKRRNFRRRRRPRKGQKKEKVEETKRSSPTPEYRPPHQKNADTWANRLKWGRKAPLGKTPRGRGDGSAASPTYASTVKVNVEDGSDVMLSNKFVLWAHDLHTKNWNISSYKRLFEFNNVADYWKVFNNFNKFGFKYMHFFLMKEGVDPTWEHPRNRNGGVCSFKTELTNSLDIWENMNAHMVCDLLTDSPDDITGVSISPKNEWAIVKIWNGDCKNDLSQTLNEELLAKYSELSVKYRANAPEY